MSAMLPVCWWRWWLIVLLLYMHSWRATC